MTSASDENGDLSIVYFSVQGTVAHSGDALLYMDQWHTSGTPWWCTTVYGPMAHPGDALLYMDQWHTLVMHYCIWTSDTPWWCATVYGPVAHPGDTLLYMDQWHTSGTSWWCATVYGPVAHTGDELLKLQVPWSGVCHFLKKDAFRTVLGPIRIKRLRLGLKLLVQHAFQCQH